MKRTNISRLKDHDPLPLRVPSPIEHYRSTSQVIYSRPSTSHSNYEPPECRTRRHTRKTSLSVPASRHSHRQSLDRYEAVSSPITEGLPKSPCGPLQHFIKEKKEDHRAASSIIKDTTRLMLTWEAMEKHERRKWEDRAKEDLRRYKTEMDAYRKRHWK